MTKGTPEAARVIRTVLHLSTELFFAVLPLAVLGAVWPTYDQGHPHSFWQGPEWSMTACVLYGLTISRMQRGILIAAKRNHGNIQSIATGFSFLVIAPLFGVIISVIMITKLAVASDSMFAVAVQYTNLIVAIGMFYILGGYGIDRSEAE